jgi:hypothetical protein
MVLDQDTDDRDAAVRAMLVAQVRRSGDQPASLADALAAPRQRASRTRFIAGLVTAVVLALVVGLSVVAIGLGGGSGSLPAEGGHPPITTGSGVDWPQPTPSGVLLGRWTSADGGPNQTHTIHPNGLALSYKFDCSGPGPYRFSISHDSEESGTGSCAGGGGGYGDKGHSGPLTVTVRTSKTTRWALVIMGIPETYVTPRPVLTPKDAAGETVRFCTAEDMTARFEPVGQPKGVTEVRGGQLVLTNTSSSRCALAGYPGVRFLDGRTPLGQHTMEHVDQRDSTVHGLSPVIVEPRSEAYSQIEWYLPNYYPENESGSCQARTVHGVRVDLANTYAGAAQHGSFDVPVGTVTACLNGPWGVSGKYGQLSSTVFVDYSADPGK